MIVSKDLSFEQALNELEEIVNSLERGDVSLEDAIKAYERGSELKNQCEKRLKEAKMKVEKIQASKIDNKLSLETKKFND
tara:strand:+ start:176 stop:415 length:240 start_codon:yes stop_codon:yes gene_type:complete